MDIEIHISFGANSVYVQAGNLNRQFPNVLMLENGKVVEIGKTGEEIAEHDPPRWEKIKESVVFKPIFDPHNFEPKNMYWATRMIASNVCDQLHGENHSNQIICNTTIPKYELFPENSRYYFESSLERWPRLKTLTINGLTAVSKSRRYQLATFTLNWGQYILLAALALVLVIRPGLLFSLFGANVQNIPLGVAITIFVVILAVLWGVEVAWMIVMQLLLPKPTLRRIFALYQLQFISSSKMSVSKLLSSWILGKDG